MLGNDIINVIVKMLDGYGRFIGDNHLHSRLKRHWDIGTKVSPFRVHGSLL